MSLTNLRSSKWLSAALFTAVLSLTGALSAQDSKAPPPDGPVKEFKLDTKPYNGKIIISVEAFPGRIDAELEKFLKEKFKKDSLYSSTPDPKKNWTINLMAFLNKDPAGADITLVFYDKDNKESQKNLEPVQSVDIKSTKGQKIFRIPSLSISEDSGFSAGKTYLVKITQFKGGKEVTLAEAQLKLDAAPKE